MTSIERAERGPVLVLALDRPPVNALDVETLDDLTDALVEARGDDPDAVVLTGAGRCFSAGADLQRILRGDASYIDAGIEALTRAFEALFTFPRPVVAAVNGHALAGGCVLTCACDYRVMSSTAGRIGAIELAAGVPFPAWALEIMRFAVGNDDLQEIILFGSSYEPAEALDRGLIDEVVGETELSSRAEDVAQTLAKVPRNTFSLTKAAVRKPAIEAARRGAMETDDQVKAAWRSPEVLESIRRQLEALGAV